MQFATENTGDQMLPADNAVCYNEFRYFLFHSRDKFSMLPNYCRSTVCCTLQYILHWYLQFLLKSLYCIKDSCCQSISWKTDCRTISFRVCTLWINRRYTNSSDSLSLKLDSSVCSECLNTNRISTSCFYTSELISSMRR